MKTKPCGFYVLIEMDKVENMSEGGIILGTMAEHKREQNACETGTIKAFGPTAFQGFSGCDSPADWGVAIDDRVEYERYEGKPSLFNADGEEVNQEDRRLRYIPDSKIIGVIE